MVKVYAKRDCGCCEEELQFNDLAAASRAFQEAGLGNGMKIKDDTGMVHEGIDTFYGFSQEEGAAASRGLGYLLDRLGV